MSPSEAGQLAGLIDKLARVSPPRLAGVIAEHLHRPGIDRVTTWVVDLGARRLTDLAEERGHRLFDGYLAQTVLRGESTPLTGATLIPLAGRGQVVGALEVEGPASGSHLSELEVAGQVIAEALLASRGHSDLYEVARGAHLLSLPATIQHNLLPLPSFVDDEVEVGGRMEPAYDIAGDAFDYAVNGDHVHIAIFDGVGHGLGATMLASVAMAAYRLGRRQGLELPDIAATLDEAIAIADPDVGFVTGILLRFDRRTRTLETCNAGHLSPFRFDATDVTPLDPSRRQPPLGLMTSRDRLIDRWPIEPGEMVVAYTDGVINARDNDRLMLHEQALMSIVDGARHQPVHLLCRAVLEKVLSHSAGPLDDDATIVVARFP